MTNITREKLIENGFKRFLQKVLGHENAAANFQKRFFDENGETKYFITVYEYDFSSIKNAEPISYHVEVHFTRTGDSYKLSFSGRSIGHIESIVEEMFQKMNFDNYGG